MAERNSLFISRTLLQRDHTELRKHMHDFNREVSDATLQWRRLGEVGVMLVQSGEYQALTQTPRSRLYRRRPQDVAKDLNDSFLTLYERKTIPLRAAKFLGHSAATYVHVGYDLDPETLQDERDEITSKLNKMNQAPGDWRHKFQPYLSLATLNRHTADERILNAFQNIMPGEVTLYGPKARVG